MFADYHVHCEFSDDSDYPMLDVCRDAIGLGLDEICFTDHVDYGVKPDVEEYERDHALARLENGQPLLNVDYPRYFEAIDAAREQYAGKLGIKAGLELGVQSHTIDRNQALLDAWKDRMDFAICSIHEVGDKEFWTGEFQEGRTQAEYNQAYYEEMLAVVEGFKGYSVLGHLDLIKRYDPAGILPFEESRDVIAAILEQVIADGKGIELNTSSFRYGLPDLQPCTEILRLYLDLGGSVLTLGSDSHEPAHLAAHIGEVRERLRGVGYEHFCTFERFEPVWHEL